MDNLTIQVANWPEHKNILYALRQKVFIEEQGVPIEAEIDDLDPSAVHFLAYHNDKINRDKTAIGTARLLIHGDGIAQVGRMAVLREFRHRHVGSQLLQFIEQWVENQLDVERLMLNSQVQAMDFYAKQGFVAEGSMFMEAGIEHQRMEKPLNKYLNK